MTGEPLVDVRCPVRHTEVVPCDAAEVSPLLAHLAAGRSPDGLPDGGRFPRGTLTPDGRLDLCKQSLGTAHAVRIVQALQGNPHVRSLMLGTDAIGDDGARAVAALACANPVLETLYLGCNNIGPDGAHRLSESLVDAPGVTGLWLKRNPIGDAGALSLADLLRRNPRLRVLDLVNTGLGDAGVQALATALCEAERGLRHLYLSGNGLGPSATPALARVLRGAPSLLGLYLSVNRLGDAGARLLAAALADNRTLRCLELASNGLGAGAGDLLAAVAAHPALEVLNLGYAASTRVLGACANDLRLVAVDVARAVSASRTLRCVDLTRTGLAGADLDLLFEAALRSPTLVDLRITGPLPKRVADALAARRERHGVPAVPRELASIRSVYR